MLFDQDFNRPLYAGLIGANIREVLFGQRFNQRLDSNLIPSGVSRIIFGENYNQPLKHDYIPDSIKEIYFPRHFRSQVNINTDINITVWSENYQNFANAGFKKITIYFDKLCASKPRKKYFNNGDFDTVVYNNFTYEVTRTGNIDCHDGVIILRLIVPCVKSARKL